MRSLSSGSAPSSSLLRFLRSQTDNLCFFTSNTAPGCATALWPRQSHEMAPRSLLTCKANSRSLSTTARCNATLEASLLNLDFLPRPETLNFPTLSRNTRPGIVIRHSSQEGRTLLRRWASTEEDSWRRWFDLRKKAKEKSLPLRPGDLPPLPFLSDASGATLGRMKATNELKLRCTEFDENGNVVVVDGEFKKSELIAMVLPFSKTPSLHSNMHSARQEYPNTQRSTVYSHAISARSTLPCSPPSSSDPPSS